MTDWTLEISTAELRTAMNAIVDHLETQGPTVSLTEDYFWAVAHEGFDPDVLPQVTIGQVSSSWDDLARERRADTGGTITYSAVWLAEVLAVIGRSRP